MPLERGALFNFLNMIDIGTLHVGGVVLCCVIVLRQHRLL